MRASISGARCGVSAQPVLQKIFCQTDEMQSGMGGGKAPHTHMQAGMPPGMLNSAGRHVSYPPPCFPEAAAPIHILHVEEKTFVHGPDVLDRAFPYHHGPPRYPIRIALDVMIEIFHQITAPFLRCPRQMAQCAAYQQK